MQSHQEYKYWQKKGDFSSYKYNNVPLIRQVEYRNKDKASTIKSLSILGYRNGDVNVSLHVNNHKMLEKMLLKNGYPQAKFYLQDTGRYYFTIQNSVFLKKLLQELSTLDSFMSEISEDIFQNTKAYLKNNSYIIDWIKQGVFDYYIPDGTPLIYSVNYLSCDPRAFCKEISLLGYRDGEIKLYINKQKKVSAAMKAFLESHDQGYSGVFIHIKNEDDLKSTLKSLRELDGTFSDTLCRDVMKEYNKSQLSCAVDGFWQAKHIEFITKISDSLKIKNR